jgi:hypothetical protein
MRIAHWRPMRWLSTLLLACAAVVGAGPAFGQTLRYSNHREVTIPEDATLRIGPFYSSVTFSQSVGYRYMESSGSGVDFLYQNELGSIKTNGSDFPLVSTLNFRNYLLVSEHTDIDVSLKASYSYYPMHTEDDEFLLDLAEEGAVGEISMEFMPTPFIKGTLYNSAAYHVDYVNSRGILDRYGGQKYRHFDNTLGLNMDWLMSRDENMALSLSRADNVPMGDGFDDQKSVAYSEALSYERTVNVFMVAGMKCAFAETGYSSTNRAASTLSQSYSVFSNMKLTRQTTASTALGYSIASASSPEPGYEDPGGTMVGEVSLTTHLSEELVHSYGFARNVQGGFSSDFETVDAYQYRLDWKGDLVGVNLSSSLQDVTPSKASVNAYSDWTSSINISYPLLPYITLLASSSYDVIKNKGTATSSNPVEWNHDYKTWTSQIGTSFSVTREVGFSTSVQHIERSSDSKDLAYQMNIFSADLTYTHAF